MRSFGAPAAALSSNRTERQDAGASGLDSVRSAIMPLAMFVRVFVLACGRIALRQVNWKALPREPANRFDS